jgi:hypothetical protein
MLDGNRSHRINPELLSRFEPVARAQLKQVVTNRISQFFAVDSEKIEGALRTV